MSYLFQQNFVARAAYGFLAAISCFVLLLAIGLAIVISQTYQAAMENPAKNLAVE
jgi:hypothetical protein